MPLTGIDIFKLLPRTNCGECGVPTCLAFAMNLAAGKAELASCPHVSPEAREKLDEASAPPIRPVVIGKGDRSLKVGGETVMFRHEKRFENPPGIALVISDKMGTAEIDGRLKRFRELQYERVGLTLRADLLALKAESGDVARFEALVNKAKEASDGGLILMSLDPVALDKAAAACADRRPLLYAATRETAEAVAEVAKRHGCPVVAKGEGLEGAAEVTAKLMAAGLKDIVIDSSPGSFRDALADQLKARRMALVAKFRPLGFPTMVFPGEMTDDPMKEVLFAASFIAKYGGIIVLADFAGHSLFPLLVARLNIYTDPQRPLATTEGIYPVGSPDENSPVLITCNFSLTYFIVSGEIENSRVPSWLLVKETEGLSVMTAWAAGKFVADALAPFVKKCGIADRVKHRKLVIPGYAAAESGALEDELSGWEIFVGPREAANIPAYLRNWGA